MYENDDDLGGSSVFGHLHEFDHQILGILCLEGYATRLIVHVDVKSCPHEIG